MERIKQCIKDVFPECDVGKLTPETSLGDIDGWDSMNSVNLVLTLESVFGVALSGVFLAENQTLRDVETLLAARGASGQKYGLAS